MFTQAECHEKDLFRCQANPTNKVHLRTWAQRHQTPSKDPQSSPLLSHLFPLPTFTPNLLRWQFACLLLMKFSLSKILIWILMTIILIAISQFLEAFCPAMLTADHCQAQTYCMKRKIIVHWVMFSIFLGECSTCSKSLHPGNMRKNFYHDILRKSEVEK